MNLEIIKKITLDFFKEFSENKDSMSNDIFKMWWLQNKNNYTAEEFENKDNILEHSNKIIFNRGEEKNRQYGPFSESIERAAKMASLLIIDKEITTEDFFKCMIALKTSRMAYNNKYDTMLDAIGYIAGLDNYLKEIRDEQ